MSNGPTVVHAAPIDRPSAQGIPEAVMPPARSPLPVGGRPSDPYLEVDDELEALIRETEEAMACIRSTRPLSDGLLNDHHTLARRRVALLSAQRAVARSQAPAKP